MKFSIIIPVYNEKDSIVKTIEEIENNLKESEFEFEIFVVNDGSVDGTGDILINSKMSRRVKIIHNKRNHGYGYSLKKGIRFCKFETIFITDADGTYPNSRMGEFAQYYFENNLDMLVGQRNKKHIPLIRRPAKKVISLFANYVSGFKIPDLNSGFRIFNKKIALTYYNILPDGFSFTSTITLAMFSEKQEVEYLPIDYAKRDGKSKIHPVKDTINFFNLIFRTVFYFNPLKIFLPLSFFIFLSGFVVFGYSYFYTDNIMDISTVVLLLTSVQIFCLGLVADLIVKRKGGNN
ncbi:MAG: glycosyltransferase family 2 protein [Candidatus Muiribacteriota bacterium]